MDTIAVQELEQYDIVQPKPCDQVEIERLKAEISRLYKEKIEEAKQVMIASIKSACGLDAMKGQLSISYTQSYYHYTLYYYDRAGKLVRTVSPKGVDIYNLGTSSDVKAHQFVSRF